ncbi:MAG: dTDP-4-dehydrorhamnose reductase [Clostridia bacterium]|nr:dTDP-4-dehydrorhamnose reductase [Clostridia bacterium]
MKIIVTGAKGQLGSDVCDALTSRGHIAVPTDIDKLDITNGSSVMSFFESHIPDAVIHCAAYTAVDKAETEKDICTLVNEKGTENVAIAASRYNAKMICISTDYIYGSDSSSPLEITQNANPLNHYGLTKYNAEKLAAKHCDKLFIVRTSWVFGNNGANFVKTMLRLGKEKNELHVVCDQVGSPTYSYDLAELLCDMIVTDRYGTYNATNEGFCSWYDFAVRIFELSDLTVNVTPVTSDEYASIAVRPKNSRLSKASLDASGFCRLPSWEDALSRFLSAL